MTGQTILSELNSSSKGLLPAGAIGRFAVVKLWPEIKTAEDECIARLKIAAEAMGAECIEIRADGTRLDDPNEVVNHSTVDFVIHLHYDTPKFYDAFSFVALWNPTNFYHEWGYQRTSRNLITHDDFVSCNSRAADDHVARMVLKTSTHLPAKFHLYHSLDTVVYPPSLGDHKLFYAGINWETVNGGKSRHQEVLKRLDRTGCLRIYGPQLFQGVKVWEGYQSYVREIPFDGISMVHEIHKAGVALVLSSSAHKASELMSNRLFEGIASGALIICDENPFAKRFFGDSLLYIDSRNSVEQIAEDIQAHLAWAREKPDAALAKIAQAQAIFNDGFSLRGNLLDLYQGLEARQHALDLHQRGGRDEALKTTVFLLLPNDDSDVLEQHIASIEAQTHSPLSAWLVVDCTLQDSRRQEIERRIAAVPRLGLREINYARHGLHGASTHRPLGAILAELLESLPPEGGVMFVAPNERLYSNHVRVLSNTLVCRPEANSAASAAILQHGDSPVHGIHDIINFTHWDASQPNGLARFLFRVAAIDPHINIALPYLDRKSVVALLGSQETVQVPPATVVIDALKEFPIGEWNEAYENAVIVDFCPTAFHRQTGFISLLPGVHIPPQERARLYLRIGRKLFNRRWIEAQLRAIQKQGLRARLKVLRRKLS
ncbi:MAG: glycosyltransferase family 1 protein [Xylophilus ampelinus]